MSQPLYPPARPQSIGEVLDTGFRIFQSTLVRCLPYSVLAILAGQLANIHDLAVGQPLRQFGGSDPIWWAWYLIAMLLTVLLWSAVIVRQSVLAAGKPSSLSLDLGTALRRLPAVLALVVLTVGVLFLVPALLMLLTNVGPSLPTSALALPTLPSLNPATLLALALLTLTISVLALYLVPALTLSWSAILLLGLGPMKGFAYGVRLTRGHWWRTTTILTILFVVIAVLYVLAAVVAALVVTLSGHADVAGVIAVSGVTLIVMGILSMPFTCALTLATFGELRVRREGLDLERRIGFPAES